MDFIRALEYEAGKNGAEIRSSGINLSFLTPPATRKGEARATGILRQNQVLSLVRLPRVRCPSASLAAPSTHFATRSRKSADSVGAAVALRRRETCACGESVSSPTCAAKTGTGGEGKEDEKKPSPCGARLTHAKWDRLTHLLRDH